MKKKVQTIIAFTVLVVAAVFLYVTGHKTPQKQKKRTVHVAKTTTQDTEGIRKDENGFPMLSLQSIIGKENTLKSHVIEDQTRMYYTIFVPSFCDSDQDGTGDLKGVIRRLDYIQDLGCNGICLLPVMSGNSYQKYDTINYYEIAQEYGTVEDFKELAAQCQKRNIRLIMDLVLDHTAKQNRWFMEAAGYLETLSEKETPDLKKCPYVAYYRFSRKAQGKKGYARLEGTSWYYQCRDGEESPNLNLQNKNVKKELQAIFRFWAENGCGGFRLDDCQKYFSSQSQINAYLSWIRESCKKLDKRLYLIGRADVTDSRYQKFYENGLDSMMNVPFAGNDGIFVTKIMESGDGISGKSLAVQMEKRQKAVRKSNSHAVEASVLGDDTLGRCADFFYHKEEYMKFAGAVSILKSASAFLYYGEELGMEGSLKGMPDKVENRRVPMYWSTQRQTLGMTSASDSMDLIVHQFGSYEEQMPDPLSFYNYYRQAIRIRNAFPAIGRGKEKRMQAVSDGDICAVEKIYHKKHIYLLMNNSKEEKTITIPKQKYFYSSLSAQLCVDENAVILQDEKVTLPAYGIAVLE